MESVVIGKAVELAFQYTVVWTARQLKYVCCYKSCVKEMNDASVGLENEKAIVEVAKAEAENSGKLIHKKATDWLDDVANTQGDVRNLGTYEESKAKMSCCCIGAQILNPVSRHKLGRRARKKKLAIEGLCQKRPPLDEISYDPPPPGIVNPEAAANQQTDDGVFRSSEWEHNMKKIMTSLTDDRVNVIGLHGMGGVGKSTMINEVYDQVKRQCMFDEVVRVEVKVKPEIRRIQGDIAFQLGLKLENEWSSNVRRIKLRERLLKINGEQKKKKTVLIILDDLWEELKLQEVDIPLAGNDQVQIKLLLTSREKYILSDKMGARELIHLNDLNDADALTMFKFFMGVGAEGVKDDMVTKIARKCSGLPIVIEATAKALKDKALDEWENILERLDNDDVLKKLEVSYDYLPSKESKDLFLLCGISRGPSIQVTDLLKYTFGLRLYKRRDSSPLLAATTKLKKLLSHLEAASMLLKSDDHRYVKIHDRMRELAVKIVEEDRPEWAYDVTLSDNSCELPNASELKLLLSCCEGDVVELRDSFLKYMEKLNVLEFTSLRVALSMSPPTDLPDHLRNLTTLCFDGCSLDDISMIGELKWLQILSFRGSYIRKLPIQLQRLTALKMLDVSDCEQLTQIEPTVLGSLIKLEELNMENSFRYWEKEEGDDAPSTNARLSELRNMTQLSNVRIHIPRTSMLPKNGQLFSSKLTMYQIKFGAWYDKLRDEYKKFSRVLMLTFDSPDIVRQDWVQTTLPKAEFLYLSGRLDEKCESIDKMCDKGFECLKHLRMRDCPSFRFIVSSNDDSLTNLETLFLERLESLETLYGGQPRHAEALSKLRVLNINRCIKLTHLLCFFQSPSLSSQLEQIIVEECGAVQWIVVVKGDSNCDPSSHVLFSGEKRMHGGGGSNSESETRDKEASAMKMTFSFPCLRRLYLQGLGMLAGFHSSVHTHCDAVLFPSLKEMTFNSSTRLRTFGQYISSQQDSVADDLSFFSQKEIFPCLESISFFESSSLGQIWPHKVPPQSSFKMLKYVSLWHCHKMSMVFPSTLIARLENLTEISVDNCDEMRQITIVEEKKSVHSESETRDEKATTKEMTKLTFPSLTKLILKYLPKLVTVCSLVQTHYDAVSFSSLKEMTIYYCPQLRTFGQYLSSEQYSVADDLSFFSQKEIFPCLESLDLFELSKLGEIWPDEVPPQTSFNMLKKVSVWTCSGPSVLFPSTLIPRLDNLTVLIVIYCNEMRQIIKVEEKKSMHGSGGSNSESETCDEEAMGMEMIVTFPCLIKLTLKHLPELVTFYTSASACSFQFPSLETLEITSWAASLGGGEDGDADIVGAMFRAYQRLAIRNPKSITLDDGLTSMRETPEDLPPKLQKLRVTGKRDKPEFTYTFQRLLPVGVDSSSFYNTLTELYVSLGDCDECTEWRYLFSPAQATKLVNLTYLTIESCYGMEHILVGDHEDIREITFSHLKELRLVGVPHLKKFSCVDNIVLNFPSLEVLAIRSCPKMTTFSSGTAKSSPKFGDLNSCVQEDIEAIHAEYCSDYYSE